MYPYEELLVWQDQHGLHHQYFDNTEALYRHLNQWTGPEYGPIWNRGDSTWFSNYKKDADLPDSSPYLRVESHCLYHLKREQIPAELCAYCLLIGEPIPDGTPL